MLSDNTHKNCRRRWKNVESSFISFILIARMTVQCHFAPSVMLPKFKEKTVLGFLARSVYMTNSVILDLLSDLQSYLM